MEELITCQVAVTLVFEALCDGNVKGFAFCLFEIVEVCSLPNLLVAMSLESIMPIGFKGWLFCEKEPIATDKIVTKSNCFFIR